MYQIIEDLALADELWQAGVLYFQSIGSTGINDRWWTLDESMHSPHSAPSKYYPEDYAYAIYIEE